MAIIFAFKDFFSLWSIIPRDNPPPIIAFLSIHTVLRGNNNDKKKTCSHDCNDVLISYFNRNNIILPIHLCFSCIFAMRFSIYMLPFLLYVMVNGDNLMRRSCLKRYSYFSYPTHDFVYFLLIWMNEADYSFSQITD